MNLAELTRNEIERFGEHVTVIYEGREYTNVQLREEGLRLASALRKLGVKRGDRVIIQMPNCPEVLVSFGAVYALGAVHVPINFLVGDDETAFIYRDSGAETIISTKAFLPKIEACRKQAPNIKNIILIDKEVPSGILSYHALVAQHEELPEIEQTADDDLAALIYTAGTTGTPKGVMLTHANFLANTRSILDFGLVNADDNLLALLPLHHAFAFTVQLILLFAGARLTFPVSLKGPDLIACMQETGVTLLVGVPQLFYMLHKGIFDEMERRPVARRWLLRSLLRLSGALRPRGINLGRIVFAPVHRKFGGRLRILASGGARLDPAIAGDFLALGFTMTEGYGLTETSPAACFNPLDRMRPGSVGIPLPGVEVKVANPDADGVGEIAIRGPNVMKGYYKNPAATAEVMQTGWFLSGDLGFLDADGYLTITGRVKEVIVLSSGKNIYPEEVEEPYLKSPYIKEVCLVPQTAERGGAEVEGLLALVLPDLDSFRAEGMTNVFETIRWDMENIGRNLPAYKRPTGLVIVKEGFPRTRLGKIQRHLVAQRFRDERAQAAGVPEAPPSDADVALLEDEMGRRVLEYLREAVKKPVVRFDDNLELDLGMDSLARVEMLVALEEMFGVEIPDEAAAECFTVAEVVEHLQALRGTPLGAAAAARRPGWGKILTGSAPAEVQAMVEASSRPSASVVTAVTRAICAAVFRTAYRLRVQGLRHVPAHGPVILVSNHCSYFDAFILASSLPLRISQQIFYMGFEWFFRHPILAWWGRGVRVIPVDMDTYLMRALQASALVLKQGKGLCVFPEGERSVDGRVRPFRKGVGILARELKVPVLPAHISGAFESWPRGQSLPKIHRIRVRFGPVVTSEELLAGEGPLGGDEYETIVMRLRERVIALGRETTG